MDKDEHGRRLKGAMASRRLSREDIADAAGVKTRTVTNWTSGTTMPSDRERLALRALLGDYDSPGDPVIVAIGQSELVEWRQDSVRAEYRRHLAEQRELERRGLA